MKYLVISFLLLMAALCSLVYVSQQEARRQYDHREPKLYVADSLEIQEPKFEFIMYLEDEDLQLIKIEWSDGTLYEITIDEFKNFLIPYKI